MARLNPNTRQSAQFLLLEAGSLKKTGVCAPKENKPNPLKIADNIFALKKPDKLLK